MNQRTYVNLQRANSDFLNVVHIEKFIAIENSIGNVFETASIYRNICNSAKYNSFHVQSRCNVVRCGARGTSQAETATKAQSFVAKARPVAEKATLCNQDH